MRIPELKERIQALSNLGSHFNALLSGQSADRELEDVIGLAFHKNGWFTDEMVRHALQSWAAQLTEEKLTSWAGRYNIGPHNDTPKKVALIMAGNVPLVGLHDLISVLLTGNIAMPKLSSQDEVLMGYVVKFLSDAGMAPQITPALPRMKGFDAVIATGSNNSQRYFDYYFKNVPHLFRKNRSSIAILDGTEPTEELSLLMDDIFLYFGLGCRNVSRVFLPAGYNLDQIFEASLKFGHLAEHKKYMNNFAYHQSIYMMERRPIKENGLLILKEDYQFSAPVSVLNYSLYNNPNEISNEIADKLDSIQAVAGHGNLPFGSLQCPALTDYADGVDTIHFLLSLNSN